MNTITRIQTAQNADVSTGTAWINMLDDAFLYSPYAAFVLNKEGLIAHCNRRGQQRFCPGTGHDPQNVAGTPFATYTNHSQDEVLHKLREATICGHTEFEMGTRQSNGMPIPCVFRMSLLRAPEPGQRLYLMTQDHLKSSADALTSMNMRRKVARDNLMRLEAAHLELHQSLLAVEAFSRAASHDMRTPLNTMTGMLELFGARFSEDLPEDARQYLSTMDNAVQHMIRLTDTLLEHAQTATPLLKAEPVELRPLARQVCLDLNDVFTDAGVEIKMLGDSFTVMAEPMLLNVMLTNIVSNAVKYRAPDRPLVIEFLFEKDDKTNTSKLRICDNGIGFPEDDAQTIFQPFSRLKSAVEGSGIGLSTCVEVCRRHGWTIEAHGQEDAGAEFAITF